MGDLIPENRLMLRVGSRKILHSSVKNVHKKCNEYTAWYINFKSAPQAEMFDGLSKKLFCFSSTLRV